MKYLYLVALAGTYGGLFGLIVAAVLACVEVPQYGWWALGGVGVTVASVGVLVAMSAWESRDTWDWET